MLCSKSIYKESCHRKDHATQKEVIQCKAQEKLREKLREKKGYQNTLQRNIFKLVYAKDEQRPYWTCLRNKCSTNPVLERFVKQVCPFFPPSKFKLYEKQKDKLAGIAESQEES